MSEINETEPVNYELAFVVKNEETSFIKTLLEKYGASLFGEEPLQKIRLAYPIKKTNFGFLGSVIFVLPPEALPVFEADLRLQNDLLRHSLTRAIMKADKAAPGVVFKPREERKKTFSKEPAKDFEPALTNEALEKKIEEILQ